ncbi:MAG: 16S rRNA (guanine(527)-N(7))-methyltransferase RsmG [Dehalococcoidia bacterium]|nr:MAG: 16S rRNA (guanine(527)-N(7))-methyltransferase RsmG [Dehalococcoidia bacterium]
MEVLARTAERLGLPLSAQQLQQFEEYYHQLIAANRRVSLTSITDYQEVQRRHFGESLAVAAALYRVGVLKPDEGTRVLDLGAGAGFPGLPMRIVHPTLQLTILEATRKKTAFLESLLARLGLEDVTVITGRAEAVAHDPVHREGYDLVLARAVAPLAVLVELALPFLKVGGSLATPKGSRAPQEMTEAGRALALCRGRIVSAEPLPSPALPLTLVLMQKLAPTPAAYPRRPGIPTKRPLR